MRKKIMLAVFMFFMSLMLVKAAECTTPESDPAGGGTNRTITCGATNQKTTHFSYPSSGQTQVFSNSLCTIRCNEDVLFLIDSAKNVRAGMGFRFPLYVSGTRTCNATYDYKKFDTDLRKLVADRDAASGVDKDTITNQISNHLQLKTTCDEWYKNTNYSMNANISLDIETSQRVEKIPYELKNATYNDTFREETEPYESCDLINSSASCTSRYDTVSAWTHISNLFGRYSMKDRFIEMYTGNVVEVPGGQTCNAKDVFFTSFYEVTRPISTNPADKGYSLTLTATNLGNNIRPDGDKWNLTINCWYALKNLIFPQESDEYYSILGGTAFMYRQVDLAIPFPNRNAAENWFGKEKLITDTRTGIKNRTLYNIKINLSTIKRIREYNEQVKYYDTFNLNEMQRSWFIENNPSIITRYSR